MTTTASTMIVPPNEGGDTRPAHDSAEADSRAAHGETVSRLTRPPPFAVADREAAMGDPSRDPVGIRPADKPLGSPKTTNPRRVEMDLNDVDKARVVEILRSRGDQQLADRVNRELPARFDPAQQDLLRGFDLPVDAEDAARHSSGGTTEDMDGVPQAEA